MIFKASDPIKIRHEGKVGAVVSVEQNGEATRYFILADGKKIACLEEQIEPYLYL